MATVSYKFRQLSSLPPSLRQLRLSYNGQAYLRLRTYATGLSSQNVDQLSKKTRNIGIIAHIDAGKTTTTERMLYYSGHTRRIGDVDDGSTVTDFLPAERARGITIQSAAITFHWPPLSSPTNHASAGNHNADSHTINLIDTPGHADFTFEVLRSLRILDGAICILDGIAGVEAQTEKVWYQAKTYSIPKIIYVNKLDRDGAAFGKTVREIATKLHTYPAVCQIPWFENGNEAFCGVIDVINLRAMKWQGGDGKQIAVHDLDALKEMEPALAEEARRARIALVELLSEHDDQMVDYFLEADEDHLAVKASEIMSSLRRILRSTSAVVPVFAGASFRNIGVQPIIDAVTELLPDPTEMPDPQIKAGSLSGGISDLVAGKLVSNIPASTTKKTSKKAPNAQAQKLETCALAFKVVNDARKGMLVYVRVYQGSLNKNTLLFNTNLQVSERPTRLLRMYANDAVDVDSILAGQIGVIPGLKHARTGDTLVAYTSMNPKTGPPSPFNELQLRPIEVPPPVFFASVEPNSVGEQKSMEEALSILLREDPSLQLSVDEESGQTHLSGMGELHLEIARDRLINDMKAKCSVGKIEIGFRECVSAEANADNVLFDREIAGRAGKAGCSARVEPALGDEELSDSAHSTTVSRDGNSVTIELLEPSGDENSETSELGIPSHLTPTMVKYALQTGASAALARGPQHSLPAHGVHVHLSFDATKHAFGAVTTSAALSAAARLATTAALKKSHHQRATHLIEPVMNVLISVDEASLGPVVHDLTSARGGQIISLENSDALEAEASGSQAREDIPIIDIKRVYAPPDPWESGSAVDLAPESARSSGNAPRTINAKVPLQEMVGYLKHLRSLTAGRGTFVMSVDKFEKMAPNREKAVLRELRGM